MDTTIKKKILKNILMCPKQRTKKPGKGLLCFSKPRPGKIEKDRWLRTEWAQHQQEQRADSGSASPAPAPTCRAALPRWQRLDGQGTAPGSPGTNGLSARCPITGKRQHTLNSPYVGFTLGVPFGPLEWEVSEIHDLRQ